MWGPPLPSSRVELESPQVLSSRWAVSLWQANRQHSVETRPESQPLRVHLHSRSARHRRLQSEESAHSRWYPPLHNCPPRLESQPPHDQKRFRHDARAHLGPTCPPVGEHDGYFDDAEALHKTAIGDFDLKGVAIRLNRV